MGTDCMSQIVTDCNRLWVLTACHRLWVLTACHRLSQTVCTDCMSQTVGTDSMSQTVGTDSMSQTVGTDSMSQTVGPVYTASVSIATRISAADSNKPKRRNLQLDWDTFCWQAVRGTGAVWRTVRVWCNGILRETERVQAK